jgi:hypothetical protein
LIAKVQLLSTQSSQDVLIDEPNFNIQPDETINLNMTINGARVGQIREIFKVIVNDEEQFKSIDVISTVIEHSIALVGNNDNRPITFLNFENIYFGNKKNISTYLCNNGPNIITYKLKVLQIGNEETIDDLFQKQTPQTLGVELANKIITVDKYSGNIDPFDSCDINFTFNTEIQEKSKGFVIDNKHNVNPNMMNDNNDNSTRYNYKCIINVGSINCKVEIPIEGNAFLPNLCFSETEFYFGDCQVNENKIFSLNIQNRNDYIPIDVNFEKIPQFNIDLHNL